MAEPTPKRFASVTDADVDAVISDRTPKSTDDATKNWVRVFEEFLKLKGATSLWSGSLVRRRSYFRLPVQTPTTNR